MDYLDALLTKIMVMQNLCNIYELPWITRVMYTNEVKHYKDRLVKLTAIIENFQELQRLENEE